MNVSTRKVIATLMTVAGCVLTFVGKLTPEFCALWGVVITAYFGRDRSKEVPYQHDPSISNR